MTIFIVGESCSFKFSLPIGGIESKGDVEVLLLDLSGIQRALFRADAVTYRFGNGENGDRCRGNLPYLIDTVELTNQFGGFASESERETYFLLDNYSKVGLFARAWLLRILYKALDEVNTDKFVFQGNIIRFRGTDLVRTTSIIQVDIISQIMMYIEDLIILLIANQSNDQNFYDFLDRKDPDLGERITTFLNNVDSITDQEMLSMFRYVNVETLGLDAQKKESVKKIISQNISEMRSFLKDVKQFRETHTQVFRRYKHAGLAMFLGGDLTTAYPYTEKKFDSTSMIFSGPDPTKNAIPIPYSADVITAYQTMIFSLQRTIADVVENRIGCLNRRIDRLIPLELYGFLGNISDNDIQAINSANDELYRQNPHRACDLYFHLTPQVEKDKVQWYVDLDKFLAKTKTNMEMEKEQNKSLLK